MKLMDMGYKDNGPTAVNTETKSPKIRFPSFSLTKNIPEELMSKDIGEECRIEMIVKVIGKSIDQYSEDRNERLELEIHKLGYLAKAGKMSKDEYLNASDEDRKKNDEENLDEDNKEDESASD